MIKNKSIKSKCAKIDISNDLLLLDNLSNPYCYNFGRVEKKNTRDNVKKLHNRTDPEFFGNSI